MLERLGRYEILERIAAGGQGTVYRAQDTVLDRVVAIKVINQSLADDPSYLAALQREARLAAGLDHPNIIAVYDFQVEDGTAFIVMEYVPDALDKHFAHGTRVPWRRAVEIAAQVARALDHAHFNRVVHRDIKPSNILLREDGSVAVSDFGIARALASSTRSQTASIMGTPTYMAPEQWAGGRSDGRLDQYALGIALFEIIAGEPPFHGESYAALFVQHRDAPVPDLPANAVVPSAVDEIIQKATEKDPGDRFISSGEMASALGELIPESAESNEQWSAGSLPLDPSQSVPLPSRPRLPARSHARSGYAWWGFLPLRAFFVGFLILLVLGGILVIGLGIGESSDDGDLAQFVEPPATRPISPTTVPDLNAPTPIPATILVANAATLFTAGSSGASRAGVTSTSDGQVPGPIPESVPPTAKPRIAFFSNRDYNGDWKIWVVDAGGSDLTLVTKPGAVPGWERFAAPQWPVAWSPDATEIAFASVIPFEGWGIFVAAADDSGVTRHLTKVPNDGGTMADPVWSPNGRRIAFAQSFELLPGRGKSQNDLMVVNSDGSFLTRLTDTEIDGESGPVWSPDGQKVAYWKGFRRFDEDRDEWEELKREIWVMNSDGSAQRRLSKTDVEGESPTWSPDGTKIALWGMCVRGRGLCVINSDGSGLAGITASRANFGWSTDGTKIVLEHGSGLAVVNADGTNYTTYDHEIANGATYPSWSPYGSNITFNQDSDLWVMDADGSRPIQLTDDAGQDIRPSWSP